MKLRKIAFILAVLVVVMFASCDTGSFSEGTITVSVSGIDQLASFNPGTSDIYFYAHTKDGNTYTRVTPGTWIDGYSGSATSQTIGVPGTVFSGGEIYYIDVLVDIDGNDNLSDGLIYWLTFFEEVVIDGNVSVSVNNTDFEIK
jgi:hypothetical protein